VNCDPLLLCNVRYYELYIVGHRWPSFATVGTNLPFCFDVPLNTNQSMMVMVVYRWNRMKGASMKQGSKQFDVSEFTLEPVMPQVIT